MSASQVVTVTTPCQSTSISSSSAAATVSVQSSSAVKHVPAEATASADAMNKTFDKGQQPSNSLVFD